VISLIRTALLVLGLATLVNNLMQGRPDFDAPRRPSVNGAGAVETRVGHAQRRGPVLPPPSDYDPVVEIESKQRRNASVGTGFAMHESGLWITARHVIQDCAQVVMRMPRGWLRTEVVWRHPNADLAMVRTRGAPGHFALSETAAARDQNGYAFGFPQGRPGSVHGHLIGRTQMRAPGLFAGASAALAWAEVGRQPQQGGTLGGISGGPLLDDHGRLLGVIVAETPRRGRFETVAPEVLRALAGRRELLPPPTQSALLLEVPERTFGQVGDRLRQQLAVTQIGCMLQ
jgi:serine protease Do